MRVAGNAACVVLLVWGALVFGESPPLPNARIDGVDQFLLAGDYVATHSTYAGENSDANTLAAWDLNSGKLVGKWGPSQRLDLLGIRANTSPKIAVLQGGGIPSVAFIDMAGGKEVKTAFDPGTDRFTQRLGFNSVGSEFLCMTGKKIVAINPGDGSLIRTISLAESSTGDISSLLMTKMASDGKTFVLCMSDKMVALDQNGGVLWRVISGNGDMIYDYPQQPIISDSICVYSGDSRKIYTIKISDGKPDGGLGGIDPTHIFAVSPNARHIALLTPDGMAIQPTGAAGGPKVMLSPAQQDIDCQFSGDGKTLVGMEERVKKGYDEKTDTVIYGRESPTLMIFDVTTGKLLKSFELKQP